MGFLEFRAEDAAGKERRNNIRIIGLPEGIGRDDMVEYLENWIKDTIVPEGLSKHFAIERAHRVPARLPSPGLPPRPVLARLLNFRDRYLKLQKSRQLVTLEVENSKVMIFPDFTAAVSQQRATFLMVKRKMRELGLKYALLFPAKLKVMTDDKTLFFTEAELAWEWLESRFPERAGDWIRKDPRPRRNKTRKRNKIKKPTKQQSKDEQHAAIANISSLLGERSTRSDTSGSGAGLMVQTESDTSSACSVKEYGKSRISQTPEDIMDSDATT